MVCVMNFNVERYRDAQMPEKYAKSAKRNHRFIKHAFV